MDTNYTEAEKERWTTCYHEAGHAVVYAYGQFQVRGYNARSTQEINIYPPGGQSSAYGGFVPLDETRYNPEWEINCTVAGHHAEALNPYATEQHGSIWNNPGCGNDLAFIRESLPCDTDEGAFRHAVDEACNAMLRLVSVPTIQAAIVTLARGLYVSKRTRTTGRKADIIIGFAMTRETSNKKEGCPVERAAFDYE